MSALGQLFLANFREFARDRTAIFWSFAFVAFFALLFGLLAGRDARLAPELALVAEAGAPRAVVEGLAERLATGPPAASAQAAAERFERRGVGGVLSVGAGGAVRLVYDADFDPRGLIPAWVERALREGAAPAGLEITARSPRGGQAIDRFVPGALALLLMQLGLFGTAMPMLTLRVRGVLRRLAATPVSPLVMIAAPILVRVVIVALQIALVLAVSAGVFAFRPSADRWLAATAMLALGTVTFVALGLTIASVARTAEAGSAIGSALQVPMLFLSGVFFPVQSAPAGLRPLMALWPSTHLADALGQTLTHAAPVFGLGVNTAVLGAWLLVCGALSSRGFAVR